MRLLLIRHGEVAGDPYCTPERPVTGCLSENNGIRQAEAAAEMLKLSAIDVAFSSSYGRALQTAEIVMRYHPNAPIKVFDFLQEWQVSPELRKSGSKSAQKIIAEQADLPAEQMWKTDLGEGCYEIHTRIIPPLLKELGALGVKAQHGGFTLLDQAKDLTVAIFAHGGSLGVILSFLLGLPPFPVNRFAFELTGIAELAFYPQNDVYYPTLRIKPLA